MRLPNFYKRLLCYITLVLVLSIGILCFFFYHQDSRKFTEFCTTYFQENLTSNALNLHYTIAHPEDYGIYTYEATLPTYAAKDILVQKEAIENNITLLASIDVSKLNEQDAYTYKLLNQSLTLSLESLDFPYYNEPLSPASGAQTQLPILLAEYTFRKKTDVDNYLSILESCGAYFDSLLVFEKEKKSVNQFMSYSSALQVIEQCNTIITSDDLSSNSHFLQTTFEERLTDLMNLGLISEIEKSIYIEANNEILYNVILPTYKNMSLTMAQLADNSIAVTGLASYPLGKEYYCYLLQANVGSSRSISNLKSLLEEELTQKTSELTTLCNAYPQVLSYIDESTQPTFTFNSETEILTDLQLRMAEDFPILEDDGATNYEVKVISTSLENYTSPAFYLTPPIDDSSNNVIYINNTNSLSGISLYTTLAHEGYPGHLYQSVYHQLFVQEHNIQPAQELLWYAGYLEGWALYVEFIAYDFLTELAQEAGNSDYATYIAIEKHNRQLQLCLLSLLDVAIHFDGANYQKVHSILNSYGISDPSVTFHIYEYICNEPTTYLKYYLGYLEILELQDTAQTLAGDSYNDYIFHSFLLDYGPADFKTLSETLLFYYDKN